MHANGQEVKGEKVWNSPFKCLMNEKIEREAIVSSMGVEAGGKCECAGRN